MPRKRINKIKKNFGKLLLASLALFIGHGAANASNPYEATIPGPAAKGTTVKRKEQKANPTDDRTTIVDSNVRIVGIGVLASEGVAASGEKIYFGMEMLNDESKKGWETYARHANLLTNSDVGYLTGQKGIASKTDPNDLYPNDVTKSGFTDTEYKQYVDMLNKKGFYKDSKQFEALRGVSAGIAGFDLSEEGGEIVYISKKPITGPFKFPKNLPENPTLKQFNGAYSDIVMLVRYNHQHDKNAAMVRGVSKNPAVIVEGGYNKVAIPLFGFVGRCMEKLKHKESYLFVEPLPDMHKLIVKSFTNDDIFVEKPKMPNKDTVYDQPAIPKNLNLPSSRGGFYDSKILIKINALKKVGLEPVKANTPSTKVAHVPINESLAAQKLNSLVKGNVASKPTNTEPSKTNAAKPSIDFDKSLLEKDITSANVAGHFRNLKTALNMKTTETDTFLNGLNSDVLDENEVLTIQNYTKTLDEAEKTFLIKGLEASGLKLTLKKNANLQVLNILKKSIAKTAVTPKNSTVK